MGGATDDTASSLCVLEERLRLTPKERPNRIMTAEFSELGPRSGVHKHSTEIAVHFTFVTTFEKLSSKNMTREAAWSKIRNSKVLHGSKFGVWELALRLFRFGGSRPNRKTAL